MKGEQSISAGGGRAYRSTGPWRARLIGVPEPQPRPGERYHGVTLSGGPSGDLSGEKMGKCARQGFFLASAILEVRVS
jgi:hypothetical protein